MRPDAAVVREVERAFRSLPDRYLGAPEGFDATWRLKLSDIGRTWDVRCSAGAARVRAGMASRRPDVVIGTDAETWLQLRAGEINGIEAFAQRRLYARGNLDLAVGFEGMFRSHDGQPPQLQIHDIAVGKLKISTLEMGSGPDVMLIHGLGATKASFFDTAAGLARAGYRVHAVDLPGFGGSSKPRTAPYGPAYFVKTVLGVMDALGIERAHFVGNSMGGRVSLEMGLAHPERVAAMVLLCPAVAFVKRPLAPLLRLARPELGLLPHALGRRNIEMGFWSLFADRDLVDPTLGDIVTDEFERVYRSQGGRVAFLTAGRELYLGAPFGRNGFYPRLAELEAPALFVWGTHDKLIPAGLRRHVEEWLPSADHITLQGCGHVPQVERPDHTTGIIRRFFGQADALGTGPRLRLAA
jgi:pimeloyl-ACP methyl ester carboxylesterase